MPSSTDLLGLAAAAGATAAVLLATPGIARLRAARPVATLLAALALCLVPLGTLSAAGYVRGVVGDLSVTTTLLLAHHLLRPVFRLEPIAGRSRAALQSLLAAGGLLLYPLTLGYGPVDPYRLGFGHVGFLCVLLAMAAGALLLRLHFVASALALSVLAWAAGLGESHNAWDYLLDPLAAAWGLSAVALRLVRRLRAAAIHETADRNRRTTAAL